MNISMEHVFVCGCFHLHTCPQGAEGDQCSYQSSRSLHSLRDQLVLGAQCPVASQWAVLSVIPAHEPDSHHKAPIVFRLDWVSLSVSFSSHLYNQETFWCLLLFLVLTFLPATQSHSVLSLGLFNFNLGGFTKAPCLAPIRLLSESN